jgi:hypothetical protein
VTYSTRFSGRTSIFLDSGLVPTFSISGARKAVFGLPVAIAQNFQAEQPFFMTPVRYPRFRPRELVRLFLVSHDQHTFFGRTTIFHDSGPAPTLFGLGRRQGSFWCPVTYSTRFSGRITIFHDSGQAPTFSASGAGKAVFGLP